MISIEQQLEAFEDELEQVIEQHCPSRKHSSNKKIKLAHDERGYNMRMLLWDAFPDALISMILQYTRGESQCSRDKLSCTTCGLTCVDCNEKLWCLPLSLTNMPIPNFNDCPMCGELGPRCGGCQTDHLQKCTP